ncbi:hypothetical protein ABFA07_012603 [Porites harrisoni]
MVGMSDASREAAFVAFEAEFSRNGFQKPEGLIRLLRAFAMKPGGTPKQGLARLYRCIWAILWFGSKKTLGADVGKPTYVFPSTRKRVIREIIPGALVDKPDPTHAQVYKVNIGYLALATWPAAK